MVVCGFDCQESGTLTELEKDMNHIDNVDDVKVALISVGTQNGLSEDQSSVMLERIIELIIDQDIDLTLLEFGNT
jgi:hypothetical protein